MEVGYTWCVCSLIARHVCSNFPLAKGLYRWNSLLPLDSLLHALWFWLLRCMGLCAFIVPVTNSDQECTLTLKDLSGCRVQYAYSDDDTVFSRWWHCRYSMEILTDNKTIIGIRPSGSVQVVDLCKDQFARHPIFWIVQDRLFHSFRPIKTQDAPKMH